MTRHVLCAVASAAWLCSAAAAHAQLTGDLRAHDPSRIVQDGDRYYLFYTDDGVGSKSSADLVTWADGPPAMAETSDWVQAAVPGFRGNKFWAPDVVKVGDRYYLYYSVSRFGRQTSAIALATNATLNPEDARYEWVDRGAVIQSNEDLPYNAIDPALLLDDDGKLWMAFGSFWEGLFLIELDPATGLRADPAAPPVHLASHPPETDIEAACLHQHDGRYYLFVNWGRCCRGVRSTYHVLVGRADAPTGPFVDKNGVELTAGGGSPFLDAAGRFLGPGHVGFVTDDNGVEYVSYHYYDGEDRGRSKLQLRKLRWTADGWPEVAEESTAQ
jgi:arabinan endo-1,5-alpha-L-arabinosidase